MQSTLAILDWVIIFIYFAIILFVAWKVTNQQKQNSDEYFLAGRNLSWFVVGASIFASNIGSEHLVGLAGSGATDGVAMAHYELHAWCLLILGWVMAPFYIQHVLGYSVIIYGKVALCIGVAWFLGTMISKKCVDIPLQVKMKWSLMILFVLFYFHLCL